MLSFALIVFFIAAAGGLFLASFALRRNFAPWPVSVAHALVGAVGLLLLVVYVITEGDGGTSPLAALISLVIAALGGFYLASLHGRKQLAPKLVVLVHAGFAVVGVGILLQIFIGI